MSHLLPPCSIIREDDYSILDPSAQAQVDAQLLALSLLSVAERRRQDVLDGSCYAAFLHHRLHLHSQG